MNRKVCLVILVCTAAVLLVKSESTIEIDKNGEEYEVKRFHIPGRRLNEGRSQCVVTRRKRASLPKPMYSNDASNDEVDDKYDGYTLKGESEQPMLFYSPPLLTTTAEAEEGSKDKAEVENKMDNMQKDKKEDDEKNNMVNGNTNKTKEMDEQEHENKDEGDDDAFGVIQLDQLSNLGQMQMKDEPVVASATSANEADANAIVVVQSHVPPKVNPQTHAVFALLPINHGNVKEKHINNDYYVDYVDGGFDLEDELIPISSSDIWSTDGDLLNEIYDDDFDSKPLRAEHMAKQTKKPLESNKKQKRKKHSSKPKRKNKYSNNGNSNANKRPNNKKRPTKTSVHRPINTHRRVPNKNSQSNRNRHVAIRNPNRKNIVVIDQGSHANDVDDKNINCVIIRKEPPSTPAPSFWNLFARNSPRASGQFGKRKRVGMRFVA